MMIVMNVNCSSTTEVATVAGCGSVDPPSPSGRKRIAALPAAVFPTIISDMACSNASRENRRENKTAGKGEYR
jgi:hypothetical protein